jgi:hypothetical protein
MMSSFKKTIAVALCIPIIAGVAIAEPGQGIKIDNLTISPFMDLTARYDSNVYQSDKDAKDDYIGEGDIGVAVQNQTDMLDLGGRLWGQLRRYNDATEKDADDWGASAGILAGEKEMLAVALYGKYAKLEDFDRTPGSVDRMDLQEVALELTGDPSERAKRELFEVDAGVGKQLTDKVDADLAYSFFDVNYDESGYYNWKEHRGNLTGGYKVTDKTTALLTGVIGQQDSDGLKDKSDLGIVRLGLKQQLTDKTSVRVEGGYEHYSSGAEGADEKNIFNYMVNGAWQATDKITLKLTGKNGIVPASLYANNTKEVTSLALGGYYRLIETVQLGLSGSFSEDKYDRDVTVGTETKEDKTKRYGGQFRVDYIPAADFYNVFASVSFTDADSTIEDYEQWKAALGLQLRY